jgi:hypothetical protein
VLATRQSTIGAGSVVVSELIVFLDVPSAKALAQKLLEVTA